MLSRLATRGHCSLLRGDPAACNSPVRGSRVPWTPAAPLLIFQLTLRFEDSFISVTAAGLVCPGRDLSFHPSILPPVCPSSSITLPLPPPPGGASASAPGEGQTYFEQADNLIGDSSPGARRCVEPSLVSLVRWTPQHTCGSAWGLLGGRRCPFYGHFLKKIR